MCKACLIWGHWVWYIAQLLQCFFRCFPHGIFDLLVNRDQSWKLSAVVLNDHVGQCSQTWLQPVWKKPNVSMLLQPLFLSVLKSSLLQLFRWGRTFLNILLDITNKMICMCVLQREQCFSNYEDFNQVAKYILQCLTFK